MNSHAIFRPAHMPNAYVGDFRLHRGAFIWEPGLINN